MSNIKITYVKGYPSKKCISQLIEEYFKDLNNCFFMYSNIGTMGQINWQRQHMNKHINSFVDFITEKGIEVTDVRLYESPNTGAIKFKKRENGRKHQNTVDGSYR